MQGRHNSKFGRELVRSVPDPLWGKILTGQVTASGDNEYHQLSADSVLVEGVAIKALPGNSGIVYIVEHGEDGLTDGYPLSAGDSVAIAINNLNKIHLFMAVSGDGVAYLAIHQLEE